MVCKGATIGANATIVCGVNIGKYAFIAAGCGCYKKCKTICFNVGNSSKTGWMDELFWEKFKFPTNGNTSMEV